MNKHSFLSRLKIGKTFLKLANTLKWTHVPLACICLAWVIFYKIDPTAAMQHKNWALGFAVASLITVIIDLTAKAIRAFGIPILHDIIINEDNTKGVIVKIYPDNK